MEKPNGRAALRRGVMGEVIMVSDPDRRLQLILVGLFLAIALLERTDVQHANSPGQETAP
ncbi:hypothetical protein D9M70_597720 [compost metagenome]